jgi:hypothetical protein
VLQKCNRDILGVSQGCYLYAFSGARLPICDGGSRASEIMQMCHNNVLQGCFKEGVFTGVMQGFEGVLPRRVLWCLSADMWVLVWQ